MMSGKQWEIYAAYGGLSAGDLVQIMDDRNLNPFTQAKLLAMLFKENGRAHYKALVQEQERYPKQISKGLEWLKRLGLERSLAEDLATLPCYTFALEFQFKLAKPYLSQDDDAFYVIDNPVRKDKVFKVPYVAPTSWKGNLRAAITQRLLDTFGGMLPTEVPAGEAEREELLAKLWAERAWRVVLFGNEKENDAAFLNRWLASHLVPEQLDADERERNRQVKEEAKRLGEAFEKYLVKRGYRTEKIEGRRGRLFFFPTFFNRIGWEIINPHDRKRRVGKNPIPFECVPAEAIGTFRLVYVPYDFLGEVTPNESALQEQVVDDLQLVAEGLHAMFTIYGFGAKTSSGYGVAEDAVEEGRIWTNISEAGQPISPPEEPVMPKDLREFLEQHPDEDFSLKPNEWREQHSATKAQRTHYKEARQLYRQYQQELDAHQKALAQWNAQAASPAQTFLGGKFDSLTQLMDETAKTLAEKLTTGGAA